MTRRDNGLQWTPFMEESLRTLLESPEWEGDLILATQTRLSLITQQLTDMSMQQSFLGEARTPIYLHHAYNSQLQDIQRTIPPNLSQDGMPVFSWLFQIFFVPAPPPPFQ